MDFCKNEQIQVEVYFPIAHGEALKNPIITELAAKYGVSAAQLCIWYVLQLGTIALPKTANPEHMKNNADIDFVITDGDFQTLLQMEELQDYVAYNIFPVFSGKPLVQEIEIVLAMKSEHQKKGLDASSLFLIPRV